MALKKQGGIWRITHGGQSPGSEPRYARRRRECRGTRLGILTPGEFVSLAGGALGEHQLQLAENQIPVLAAGVPVLDDSLRGQV